MAILEHLRTKSGLTDAPNSTVLTQELGVQLENLNRLDKDIEAVKGGLALDALRSIDGGKTSTDKLERLGRQRLATESIVDALRIEIAAAVEVERTAAEQAQWDRAQALGDALIEAARKVDAAAVAMAEALGDPLGGLKASQAAFQNALPNGYSDYGRYASKIASDGIALALDAIKVRIRKDQYHLERMQSLEARANEEVWARTLGNPSQPKERLKPPRCDSQGRRINEFNHAVVD